MITYRRLYLDEFLGAEEFAGEVLDVGGERVNRRGDFRIPSEKVKSWTVANIDPKTSPDVVCSADALPFEDGKFDYAVLSEVVEHLREPKRALKEAARVLRSGGKLVVTLPFLFSIHGDPDDYQRWTPSRIRLELENASFSHVEVRPMGGILAVLLDLFEMHCHLEFSRLGRLPFATKVLRGLTRKVFGKFLLARDRRYRYQDWMTTGYYVKAVKA